MPHPHSMRAKDVFAFGPFKLFATERQLQKDGETIAIGGRALELLVVLVERAGAVVSHKELIARAWPDVTVEDANLRVHIAALRRALGDDRGASRYISSVAGRGYCFVAAVDHGPAEETLREVDVSPALAPTLQLPSRLPEMFGREEAVRAISMQLMTRRFVSIVGPGGVGKTTVAVSVAHASLNGFSGAVFFVDLGALGEPKLVPAAIASALGCTLHLEDPLISLLVFLRDKRLLLVLDNCEPLKDAAARLAKRLISEAPRVHILATSREVLGVAGENIHFLGSLDGPPERPDLTSAEALRFPATQLFMNRAVAAGYRSELSDPDAVVVAEICRKLDGMALAIELAAGRAGSHGIRGTAELLDKRWGLAWKGRRTALPRHQTLTSMLDWSFRLLSEREQRVLCRLSVFVGWFTVEAACSVASSGTKDEADVAEFITALTAKSLISAISVGGTKQYRLLNITRTYALAKLDDLGETDDARRKHAMTFCRFLQKNLTTPAALDENGLTECRTHIGNMRAALDWALSDRGDPALGVQLTAAAAPLLIALSLLEECRDYCARALALAGDSHLGSRAEMTLQEAMAYASMFTKGNGHEVRLALDRGLALAEQFNDANRQLHLLAGLNSFFYRTGDFHGALAIAGRARSVAQSVQSNSGIVMAEWMLGVAHHCVGNQADAERHCQAGMIHAVEHAVFNPQFFGFDHRVRALVGLAGALWLRGYANRAMRTAQQGVDEATALNRPISVCISLYTAHLFVRAGAVERARNLAERMLHYSAQFHLRPFHAVGTALMAEVNLADGELETGVRSLKQALGELHVERQNILYTVFSGALAEGLRKAGRLDEALMTVTAAIEHAMNSGAALELAELLRLKAQVLAEQSPANYDASLTLLDESLRVASEQTALAYQLRTATTSARLLCEIGQRRKATELLLPICDRFTEGFETPDLRTARALLAKLSQVVP